MKELDWLSNISRLRKLILLHLPGSVQYYTYKPIKIGEELLVYYGDEYFIELGFNIDSEEDTSESKTVRLICFQRFFDDSHSPLWTQFKRNLSRSMSTVCYYSETSNPGGRMIWKPCFYQNVGTSLVQKMNGTLYCMQLFAKIFTRQYCVFIAGTLYHCQACAKLFKTVAELNTHQCGRTRGSSGKEKVHKCHICEKMFTMRGNLDKHIKTVHNKVARHSCPYCKYRTDYKRDLTAHIATHTGEKKYKCTQCDYTAIEKQKLTSHIYSRHTNKTYRCRYKQCDVKKPSQEELFEHVRTEHPMQKYVCETCPMSFSRSGELTSHKLSHSAGTYKCKYCDKLCRRAGELNTHLVTHTGERKHVCSVCNKGFTTNSSLRRHMRKHNKEM